MQILLLLIAIQCVLANAGLYCLKIGVAGRLTPDIASILSITGSPAAWCGILLYGASFTLLIAVISRGDMSFVVPVSMAINFALASAIGIMALAERVSPLAFGGMLLVLIGATCMVIGKQAGA